MSVVNRSAVEWLFIALGIISVAANFSVMARAIGFAFDGSRGKAGRKG